MGVLRGHLVIVSNTRTIFLLFSRLGDVNDSSTFTAKKVGDGELGGLVLNYQ